MANEVETIIDSATVTASGGTASGTLRNRRRGVVVHVDGDSNSTDVDVVVSGATLTDGSVIPLGEDYSRTTVDATGSGTILKFSGVEGFENIELTVTNNAASDTVVTVVGREY